MTKGMEWPPSAGDRLGERLNCSYVSSGIPPMSADAHTDYDHLTPQAVHQEASSNGHRGIVDFPLGSLLSATTLKELS